MERDQLFHVVKANLRHFNSHAHVERDVAMFSVVDLFVNFNSHAHVERDILMRNEYYSLKISTHTLTWSVTIGIADHASVSVNFNSHAHVERDSWVIEFIFILPYFNSHAHVERDRLFEICNW